MPFSRHRVPATATMGARAVFESTGAVRMAPGMGGWYTIQPEPKRIDRDRATELSGAEGGKFCPVGAGGTRFWAVVKSSEEVRLPTRAGCQQCCSLPGPPAKSFTESPPGGKGEVGL